MLHLLISRLVQDAAATLQSVAHSLSGLYALVQEAHAAAARFESLAQMSDTELARRGLKREGLAQAVFTVVAEA